MIFPTSPEIGGMGHSIKRKEDLRFIQGKGNYVDDVNLPDMVYGHMVRSPYAHARLKSINTEKATQLPGVLAVITGEDLAKANLAWMPTLFFDKQMVLATGKVLFQSQEVAFVVAEDQYTAADAAELVEVEYEELPVLVDPHKALDPASPILREDREEKTNHIFHWEVGDRASHGQGLRRRGGQGQVARCLSALPPGAARNLWLRRRPQHRDWTAYHLSHFASAACSSHALLHRRRHPGKQHPCHFARHRRRLWQQGSHLSGVCLRCGRVIDPRTPGEMD